MAPVALGLAAILVGATAAQSASSPYPVHIERQRGSILVIEHTPVPARAGVQKLHRARVVRTHRVRPAKVAAVRKVHRRKAVRVDSLSSALAGGCRDGGYVRRRLPTGEGVLLHRDVCEGIAPVSSLPGRF
jgi:hypothetical protein